MSDSVVFPCFTTEWLSLKQKLSEARDVAGSSLQVLTSYLQKVTTSTTASPRACECTGARPKTRNIFADLVQCLDAKITVRESDAYLTRILLHVIDRAIAIETHQPQHISDCRNHRGIPLYQPFVQSDWSLVSNGH